MIDTEGYEIRRLPWWYSPLTKKQVHLDAYLALSFWREITEADLREFLRERGFVGEEYLLLEGEYERGELEEREALFKIDPTKPTIIRRYVHRRYVPEVLTSYTIIEKLRYLKTILTFSIDTGAGHERPFFAEVTCDTTTQAGIEDEEILRRVVNAVLKVFFIVFDADKVVKTAEKEKDPDWLIKYKVYLQKHADPIHEVEYRTVFIGGRRERVRRGMDGFLEILMDRILDAIAINGVEYFVTREAFISIGVEYGEANHDYEYPTAHVIIEKTRPSRYAIERTLVIAPSTDIWIDDILDIAINYGGRV